MFIHYLKQIISNHLSLNELRFYSRWKKSLMLNASSVKDEQPWITYKAIEFLKQTIDSTASVFEYGGGGSTLFFIKQNAMVITIEHNKEWFEILTSIISKKKDAKWNGKLIEAQLGNFVNPPDIAHPDHYATDDEPETARHFKDYVSAIDNYPEGFFDLVVVDGRSRPSCIKHSIAKIKKGGWLLLDNSDRNYYLKFLGTMLNEKFDIVIDSFGASPYSKEFTKTTIWRKK